MAHNRSRSRVARLRMPVVVTLALGSVASGCGGNTEGGAGQGLGDKCPQLCNPPPPPPPPPETECPLEKPAASEACSYEGPTCNYDRCYGAHFTYSATCGNGIWSVMHTSCNPPPPVCPDLPPTAGTACFGWGECSYSVPCGPTQTFACSGSVWTLQVDVSGAPFDFAPPPGCFPPVDAGAREVRQDAAPPVSRDEDGGGAEPIPVADAGVD